MNTLIEQQRNFINDAIVKAGVSSPSALASAVGLAPSTLNRLFKDDISHALSSKTLAKIADFIKSPMPTYQAEKTPDIPTNNENTSLFYDIMALSMKTVEKNTSWLRAHTKESNHEVSKTVALRCFETLQTLKSRHPNATLDPQLPLAIMRSIYANNA